MNTSEDFPRSPLWTIDELAIMNETALHDLEGMCRSYIHKGNDTGHRTRDWEEELCYIHRELDIRATRAIVHKQWLEENPDEDSANA